MDRLTESIDAIMWRSAHEHTYRVDVYSPLDGQLHFLAYYEGCVTTPVLIEDELSELGYWYRDTRVFAELPHAVVEVYTGRELDGTKRTRQVYRFYNINLDEYEHTIRQ
jgi:hypothetical protein